MNGQATFCQRMKIFLFLAIIISAGLVIHHLSLMTLLEPAIDNEGMCFVNRTYMSTKKKH